MAALEAQPVFLSYSREDAAFARALREWLSSQGHRPWMDMFDIPAGARWPTEIDRALKASGVVIGIMSPSALGSENVLNEWDWAIANGRRLILVLIERCDVPFHYVSRNYIDFSEDREAGYRVLATALASGADRQPSPVAEPASPPAGEGTDGHHLASHEVSAPQTGSRLRRAMSRHRVTPELVGREQEQREIQRQLDAATGGNGSLLLLGGEAGIGKTTLTHWLLARAEEQGALVLQGGCYDLATTPPYGPWTEILRAYEPAGGLPQMPAEIRDDAGLASIPSQAALFDIVGEFFAEVSEHRPLVLVLEDLHWSDQATLALLRFFARFLSGLAILVVATYRDDEITRRHQLTALMPILIREAPVQRISLHRLGDEAIRTLVDERYALPKAEAERLVAYLDRLAEGNPFFAEELLRSLQDDGLLRRIDDGWRLSELKPSRVPPVVRQVIERRLARLDDATRDLLAVAAIIGHDVSYDLWRAISQASDEQLLPAAEQAIEARLLHETSDGRGVSFSHALVREALYSGLVALRRQSRHRTVADVLIGGPSADPDIVAFHLDRANDPRLREWLVAAGERALRRHAWLMAAERFNRAQQALEHDHDRRRERARLLVRIGLLTRYNMPEDSLAYLEEGERLAGDIGDHVASAQARAHRGLVLGYLAHISEALQAMESGLVELDRLQGSESEWENWQEDHRWRPIIGVQGWSTYALWLVISGRWREALAVLEQKCESPATGQSSADHHRTRALVHSLNGNFADACEASRRSASAYRVLGDRWQVGRDIQVEAAMTLRYASDDINTRREVSTAAHDIWKEAANDSFDRWSPSIAFVGEWYVSGNWLPVRELLAQQRDDITPRLASLMSLSVSGLVVEPALNLLDTDTVRTCFDRVLPVGFSADPGDYPFNIGVGMLLLHAMIALDQKNLPEARSWLEALNSWLAWSGARLWNADRALAWAYYCHRAGNHSAAREHAAHALVEAREPRQPLMLIASHRLLGMLDVDDRQFQQAQQHLDAALDLASRCEAPFERALTVIETAGLRLATGDVEPALLLLDDASAACEPLEARPALRRIAELRSMLDTSAGF